MKLLFFILGLAILFGFVFAEVPEHEASWDYKCPAGFQWSRGTASCKQADCPAGVGRTYTYDCKCPDGKKCCYVNQSMTSVIDSSAKCPDEISQGTGTTGTIVAKITQINGEVECSKDGGKTFVPCTVGTVLNKGDFISTGFGSTVKLEFSYGELQVFQTTQLRMDDFLSENNINRTQMYLRVGTVQAELNTHVPSIRADFSVTTPTAYSSIRGSKMKVEYNNVSNETTVTVTEHEAFVKGTNDFSETTVQSGKKAVISGDGKAVVSNVTAGDLGDGNKPPTITCCGSAFILLALLGFVAFINLQNIK